MNIKGPWPLYFLHVQPAARYCGSVRSHSKPGNCWRAKPDLPDFNRDARGSPKDWNRADTDSNFSNTHVVFWSAKAKELYKDYLHVNPEASASVDICRSVCCILRLFFKTRPGQDGKNNLLDRFGPPFKQENGWYSFQWLPSERKLQVDDADLKPKWRRAWHGCKLEALYSIVYHGKLFESRDKAHGERHFDGIPGVYVHKDRTRNKAESYIRFVDLCKDGIFWAVKWEVRVDRKRALDLNKNTDQWVQPEDSVRLVALWICGRTVTQSRENDSVALKWDSLQEANPKDVLKRLQATPEAVFCSGDKNGIMALSTESLEECPENTSLEAKPEEDDDDALTMMLSGEKPLVTSKEATGSAIIDVD